MATTKNPEPLDALQSLGFSEIDALVYSYLLRNQPSTGYRISHAIGKPTANTYKAIAGLERMGAVQVEDGDSRLVRAVPPRELLSQLERGFRRKKKQAESALMRLARHSTDDRLYSLRTVEQVLERAGAMIRRASSIIVADLFPGPLRELEPDLRRASARGVRISCKVYGPASADLPALHGARGRSAARAGRPGRTENAGPIFVRVDPAQDVFAAWPGEQITLVCDAEEHLLALLNREMTEVHQAIWSRSTFLSCMHHNHVAMEMISTAGRLPKSSPLSAFTLLSSGPPGLKRLQSRFGPKGSGATGPAPGSEATGPARKPYASRESEPTHEAR